jgi:hypothetical protein
MSRQHILVSSPLQYAPQPISDLVLIPDSTGEEDEDVALELKGVKLFINVGQGISQTASPETSRFYPTKPSKKGICVSIHLTAFKHYPVLKIHTVRLI